MADEPKRPSDRELLEKYLARIQDQRKAGPREVEGLAHTQAEMDILVAHCPHCRAHVATSGEGLVLCHCCGAALRMSKARD